MELEADTHESHPHPNIVMLAPPGLLGHLIPFIELAKKLVFHHNCTVTLIIPHDDSSMQLQRSLLQGIPATINPVFLPPVPADDLSEDEVPEFLVAILAIRSIPAFREAMSLLEIPAAALIVDLFAPFALDVAKELGIPGYIFYVIAANELSLAMDLAKLDESGISEYSDRHKSIDLPGYVVLSPEDFPDALKSRKSEIHKWITDLCKKFLVADGILVNSFLELESSAFQDLQRRRPAIPPVYPVGPLIRGGIQEAEKDRGSECLKWLNEQPPKSVLYVSFGSGGTLSTQQFRELAFGLEMSEQRFLWVVRSPHDNTAVAYINTSQSVVKEDPLDFLPEGFLERTKDRGLVVASWAPQIQVLSHSSTGGFVTHCGWNSILESAVFGVPLIAWPLCFEHKMNAVFLTDGLQAAIRVNKNENGTVEKSHISQVVKQLMEGEEGIRIRNRMIDVKIAAENVVSKEGSSTQTLDQIVQNWINGK